MTLDILTLLAVGIATLVSAIHLTNVRPMTRRASLRAIAGVLTVLTISILGLMLLFQFAAIGALVAGCIVFIFLIFGSLVGVTFWLSSINHVRRSETKQ